MFATRTRGRGADRLTPTRVYTNPSISNLIPLCSRCHRNVTNGWVTITINRNTGTLSFRFKDGRTYTTDHRAHPFTVSAIITKPTVDEPPVHDVIEHRPDGVEEFTDHDAVSTQ